MSSQSTRWLRLAVLTLALTASLPLWTDAAPRDDAFITGYLAAVLEREFGLAAPSLRVTNGLVTVTARDLAGADRARVVAILAGVQGVSRVAIIEFEAPPSPAAPGAPAEGRRELEAGVDASRPGRRPLPTGFLPPGVLFAPLVADPRWPNFGVSYQRYLGENDFRDVAAVSLGETFPFYRRGGPFDGQWEVGLQASVFAIFDLAADSHDLINADYFVGIPLSYRRGPLSVMARVFHQSSHLGDEFVLKSRVERVNLSYESVDLKLSYDLWDRSVRIYGGGGILFHQEPSDLDPLSAQLGVEVRAPWTWWDGALRPVVATDLQARQENDWSIDASIRAGFQVEGVEILGRKFFLMLEYFNGHSPNGQFYRNELQYIGIGAHLFY